MHSGNLWWMGPGLVALALVACQAPQEQEEDPDAALAQDGGQDPGDAEVATPDLVDPGPFSVGPTVERKDYCQVYRAVLEDMQLRCDDRAPQAPQIDALVARCEEDTTRPVLQNAVAFDDLAASICLQSMLDVCFVDEADQNACSLVLRGVLEEGQVCYNDDECNGGHCRREGRCPGRCRVWSEPGQVCGEQRHCVPGTFCDPAVWTCVQAWPLEAPCQNNEECLPGLACRRDGAARSCQEVPPRGAQGEFCDDETPCAAHLFCLSEPGKDLSSPGVCQPILHQGSRCPVGGADLEWFHRGCYDGLCKAAQGAQDGVCSTTRLHEPCILVSWEAPPAEGESSPRKPNDEPIVWEEAWSCTEGYICDEEYHYCRRPEVGEVPPAEPLPRECPRP